MLAEWKLNLLLVLKDTLQWGWEDDSAIKNILQWERETEDLRSVPSIHMVARNHLEL